MLRRLPHWLEIVIINLLCFGPFAVRSILDLRGLHSLVLFDNKRALWIGGVELVCGTLALLFLRARGWTREGLGLRITGLQTIAGMWLMLASNIAIALFYQLVKAATNSDPGTATSFKATVSLPVLIALVLINPLYDELFVVAYNLRALEGSGAAFAITLSALIRFLCHLDQGPIAAVTILPLGLIFAAVYWRWKRVWPLVVAHGMMDFLGMMPSSQ
ncbi:MAG TPA: CPBP family intramembrane glutamic endopeptidase [Thermoanaerobaculia bacterium]|nr:CPBP family intramembrane glutamic endopeptidase [Thermoanaerobaculia bacterium]